MLQASIETSEDLANILLELPEAYEPLVQSAAGIILAQQLPQAFEDLTAQAAAGGEISASAIRRLLTVSRTPSPPELEARPGRRWSGEEVPDAMGKWWVAFAEHYWGLITSNDPAIRKKSADYFAQRPLLGPFTEIQRAVIAGASVGHEPLEVRKKLEDTAEARRALPLQWPTSTGSTSNSAWRKQIAAACAYAAAVLVALALLLLLANQSLRPDNSEAINPSSA